jgi:hypothetical protein
MRFRIIALLAIVLLGSLVVACGSGTPTASRTPNPNATEHPDPEPRVREILGKLNSGDIEGFYNNLSASRRRSITLDKLQNALETVRNLVGVVPKLEIQTITAKRVGGDRAEIDATVNVVLPTGPLGVTDTAKMVWENDDWQLDDHFLEQALAVIGLSGVTGDTPVPSP